ncbi:MAG TPA: TPM domain-containing protein, partial [Longimicrobium sp.]|nr:TPM domain-containing protein [Longimicrobium sp.]
MRFPRPRFPAFALAAALLLAAAPAAAQRLQIPRPVGFVNDFANVIDPESEAAIDALIQEVRQKSGGAEIAVVTLPSLEGEPVSDVANRIAREWGVGARGEVGDQVRNTAALILVAPNDRRVRIELSEGANGFISAAEAGRIRDQYMVPAFAQGDFSTGVRQGTRAVAEAFAQNFGFQLTGQPLPPRQPAREPSGGARGGGGFLIFLIILAF